MDPTNRKAKLTPENLEEARLLHARWAQTPDKPNQTVFGERFEIGTQSAVTQFLNGKSPLSLKAARGFAKGLNCSISDFSPRLAKEAELNAQFSLGEPTALVARLASADPTTLKLVELALYENDESALSRLSPSLVAMVRGLKAVIAAQAQADSS